MHLASRLQVRANAAVLPFLALPKPLSFIGPDASLTLARTIAGSGVRKIMLVTDAVLVKLGLLAQILDVLDRADVGIEVFDQVLPDPDFDTVLAGVERLRQSAAQAVLTVGGGSPIDCAKAILMSHANDCHPAKLAGLWLYARPRPRCLPFYAIPTTAGTGSEVTIGAVVSDPVGKSKRTLVDPKMVPSMIALDPTLTVGMPRSVTAISGMDALTHAVEAYLSTMATAETDELALTATTMIMENLPRVLEEPGNLRAREDMLVASCMAGLAFTRTGLGYVHAFAHQIGGHYHVPHGLANGILLPHVVEFSKPACRPRLARLARAAAINIESAGEDQLAEAFIARLKTLQDELSVPTKVKGLSRDDFESIIDFAFREAHGTYGVPRYMGRADARTFLEGLLE